jgi:hypothetical protein
LKANSRVKSLNFLAFGFLYPKGFRALSIFFICFYFYNAATLTAKDTFFKMTNITYFAPVVPTFKAFARDVMEIGCYDVP